MSNKTVVGLYAVGACGLMGFLWLIYQSWSYQPLVDAPQKHQARLTGVCSSPKSEPLDDYDQTLLIRQQYQPTKMKSKEADVRQKTVLKRMPLSNQDTHSWHHEASYPLVETNHMTYSVSQTYGKSIAGMGFPRDGYSLIHSESLKVILKAQNLSLDTQQYKAPSLVFNYIGENGVDGTEEATVCLVLPRKEDVPDVIEQLMLAEKHNNQWVIVHMESNLPYGYVQRIKRMISYKNFPYVAPDNERNQHH